MKLKKIKNDIDLLFKPIKKDKSNKYKKKQKCDFKCSTCLIEECKFECF